MTAVKLFDRVLPFVPTLIFVTAMAVAWFGDGGLQDRRELVGALAEVEGEIVELNEHNAHLQRQIQQLHDDPATLERMAREELGMVRPDEQVFRFVDEAE